MTKKETISSEIFRNSKALKYRYYFNRRACSYFPIPPLKGFSIRELKKKEGALLLEKKCKIKQTFEQFKQIIKVETYLRIYCP